MPHRSINEQAAICRAILEGRADGGFQAYEVSLIDQAIYRRMADEVITSVVRRNHPFRSYDRARIRNPIRFSLVLSAIFGVTPLVIALGLSRWIDLSDQKTYPIVGGVAAFAAIGVAAIGWGVSGWIAHRITGQSTR